MTPPSPQSDPVFDLRDRVVVLTGACGLLGRELAQGLVQRGAKVMLADLPAAEPVALAASLGPQAAGLPCNVAVAIEVQNLVQTTLRQFGRIDVLITNQQYKPRGFLSAQAETFPEELWDAVMDVNLKGTFLLCRDVGAVMLKQGKGSIINMASTYAVVSSNPDLYDDNSLGNPLVYSASKGGVVMLSKYLGAHWARRGVRVNCLTPHGVWNHHEEAFAQRFASKSPMGRMMQPHEILGAVLFLASDASSYATGSNLLLEGGWTAW